MNKDRENLEFLVYFCLIQDEPIITFSRGRELLGIKNYKEMHEWFFDCVNNKFKHVRAALCHDEYGAKMSRMHNNANVLNIGARTMDRDKAIKITEVWLNTEFEGGRHQIRIDYLHNNVEKNNFK